MQRIMFVCHSAEVSGAEKVMLDLAEYALSQGLQVVIACPAGQLSRSIPLGSTHTQIPALGLSGATGLLRVVGLAGLARDWLRAAIRLRRIVDDRDTVTVANSLFALPAIRVAHPRNGCTWLVHDTVNEAKQRLVVRFAKSAIRRAVAVSEPTAAALGTLGISASVALLGVTIPEDTAALDIHVPALVGILGTITEWKGHRVLLEAIASIPEVHLQVGGRAFAGDTTFESELRARSSEPDLEGRVTFLGHVHAATTLRTWNVLVSPSIRPEAGPLVALEAMSMGIPVIGSDHGGTSVILGDGAGILVPPGDVVELASAIKLAITDHSLRQSLAARGRAKVVEKYDIRDNLPEMFKELVRQ